uniref:Leishmanolysin-like peptidase n=1 Tax=Ditylum brightwellii TaxID=49249 RepID=A0A7S2EQE0_9STRA
MNQSKEENQINLTKGTLEDANRSDIDNTTNVSISNGGDMNNSDSVENGGITSKFNSTDGKNEEEIVNSTNTKSSQTPDSNSTIARNITNVTISNNYTTTTNQSLTVEFNLSSTENSTKNNSSIAANSSTEIENQGEEEDDAYLPPCGGVPFDTQDPSSKPSSLPSMSPTTEPSSHPSPQPSAKPSSKPSSSPSLHPSQRPSFSPSEEQAPACLGDYVASATYCSTDQFDRPVAGMMHICIGDDFFDPENLNRNIITVMHEIGHVLGFNPVSLAHFRARDGTPLTPRDENGDVPDVEVECTGPVEGRQRGTIPLPSESILQFRDTRGGVRVADVVTPTVAQVVRNQFDCQTLIGGELESAYTHGEEEGGDDERECFGGHWERRLFPTDLMNSNVASVEYTLNISPLTLALMADTGWYQVELSHAAFVSTWGRRAGCDFVNGKCVMGDGGVTASNAPFFCNDVLSSGPDQAIEEIHGCTADLSRKAVCSIVKYDDDLPAEFDYFGQVPKMGSQVGGSDPGLDFCPVFNGFSNGLCKEKQNEEFLKVSGMEEFGVKNSRCVVGEIDDIRTALCLPIACVISDRTLRVKVDGLWKVCKFQGQIISGWWDNDDKIVCPDPSRVCPTFYCPRNCLGTNNGVCDYETGKCMCPRTKPRSPTNETTFIDGEMLEELVPCDDSNDDNNPDNWHFKGSVETDVSRLESSLSEYYVQSDKVLKDNSKDIFDEVSRIFQMSTGDAIAFVTSCIVAVFFVWFFFWRMRRNCGKSMDRLKPLIRRLIRKRVTEAPSTQHINYNQTRRSTQKDKMVATLVVNLRVNDPVILNRFRRDRMLSRASGGVGHKKGKDLAGEDRIVYQSELPPLPEDGGRVVAVVGSEFVQDGSLLRISEENDDTDATITTTAPSLVESTDDESIGLYRELCFNMEEHRPQDLRRRPTTRRGRRRELTRIFNGKFKTTSL